MLYGTGMEREEVSVVICAAHCCFLCPPPALNEEADRDKVPINRVYLSTGGNKPNKQGSEINPNKQTINCNKLDPRSGQSGPKNGPKNGPDPAPTVHPKGMDKYSPHTKNRPTMR